MLLEANGAIKGTPRFVINYDLNVPLASDFRPLLRRHPDSPITDCAPHNYVPLVAVAIFIPPTPRTLLTPQCLTLYSRVRRSTNSPPS